MSYKSTKAKGDNFVSLSPSCYNKIPKLDSNEEFAQLLNSDEESSPNIVPYTHSDSSNSGSYKSNNSSKEDVRSYGEAECTTISDDRVAYCGIDSGEGNKSEEDPGEEEVSLETKNSSHEDSDDMEFLAESQDDITERLIDSEDSGDDSQSNNDADNETSSKWDSSDSEKSSIPDSEDEIRMENDENEALLSDRSDKSYPKSDEGSDLQSNASSPSRSAEYFSDGQSSKFDSDEETTPQQRPHDDLTSKPDFNPSEEKGKMLVPSRSEYKVVQYSAYYSDEKSSEVGSCDGRSSRHESDEGVSSKFAASSSDEDLIYDSGNDQRLIKDVDEDESSGSDVEPLNGADKLEEEEKHEEVQAIRQSEDEDNGDVGSDEASSFYCSSDSDEVGPLDEEHLELVVSDESSEDELIRSVKGSENERGSSAKGSDDDDDDSMWSDCNSEEELIQSEKDDEAESASYGDGNDVKNESGTHVFQTCAKEEQKSIDYNSCEVNSSVNSATPLMETAIQETTNPTELEKTDSMLELLTVVISSASDSDDREVINKFFESSGDEEDKKNSELKGDAEVKAKYEQTMDKLDRVVGRTMRRTKEFNGNKYRSPEHKA